MDVQKQQKFLERQVDDYFAFAYALIPNRKEAVTLVKKAIQVLYVEGIDLVENFTYVSRKGNSRRMRRYLYGKVFEFAKNKNPLTNGLQQEYSSFFLLAMKQRALLFLKHKTDFNYTELEEITKTFRHEIISDVISAREML